jgi:hypothetical protein
MFGLGMEPIKPSLLFHRLELIEQFYAESDIDVMVRQAFSSLTHSLSELWSQQ